MKRGWKLGARTGVVAGLFNAVVWALAQQAGLVDAIGTGVFIVLLWILLAGAVGAALGAIIGAVRGKA
jgi:hypothetical protein